jgi:hypothetical protein
MRAARPAFHAATAARRIRRMGAVQITVKMREARAGRTRGAGMRMRVSTGMGGDLADDSTDVGEGLED